MNTQPPAWLKPASAAILFGVPGITIVLVILILAGIPDPRPVGTLVVDDNLNSGNGWDAYPEDQDWQIDQDGLRAGVESDSRIYVIAPYSVSCPCTLEISAHQVSGASDAHYGVWWGEAVDGNHTAAGLNGNGYFGVFGFDGVERAMLVEWHVFPWVLPQRESNRLRVNLFEGGSGEILINDEDAGQITWTDGSVRVGVFVETTATGRSTVLFERLRVWQK
jgi:hypothetical protein